MKRLPIGLLLLVLLIAGPIGCGSSTDPATPRGVILISVDTLRASRLGCHGNPRETSPFLDRMASEGIRFTKAYTPAPWTVPAHMSMMTGNYPALYRRPTSEIVVENPMSFHHWLLDESETTLAETFLEHGYQTAAFVDTPWLVPALGFHQGFETFDTEASLNDVADPEGGIRQISAAALTWLRERDPDRPFFLFLHCFDVHGPYAPPPPFDTKFVGDERYEARREERYEVVDATDRFGVISSHLVARDRDDEENPVGFLDAQYDGGIAFVDRELELFFDEVREMGLYDEVVVAVTSDHGESLGENDFFGHGVLYEPVMHIPWIVRYPPAIEAGTRELNPVCLIDVMPTLLALCEIQPPASLHGSDLDLRRRESEPTTPPPSATYYLEGGIRKQYGLVNLDWKYTLRFPQVGENLEGWLEDLGKIDPEGKLERVDESFRIHPGTRELIPEADWQPRFEELVRFNTRLRRDWEAFQTNRTGKAGSGNLTPAAIERLKELGYLGE